MKENALLEEQRPHRRRRIALSPEVTQLPFVDDDSHAQIHDLEQRCAILEDRYKKQTEKLEQFHLQMQKAVSERIQLHNKVKGVLQHIISTIGQPVIPGAVVKEHSLEQETALLKWKLTVIEKYMKGIFPECVEK